VLDAEADLLRLYYGAADTCVGLATARMSDVMSLPMGAPAEPEPAIARGTGR
jgi:predicted GH43/DUF377 family glycosyl hydrolase